ncbi:MAG: HepT-like ribonuclease domain-containing protein [Clostridium sp.]|uniref:HepT-like ribonuclease domain-containing protein n=1 Tax=Clostridium sp. TaxID=1506 RepID=UPI003F30E1C3
MNKEKLLKLIGDMKKALKRLSVDNVIDRELYDFLDYARLLRNRISHRYKEPSRAELLEFISENINKFEEVIKLAEKYY